MIVLADVRRNDDGAIVVFGLFFAVFLLGMLYYLVGLGNAMHYREHLQDAADASAFGAAVVHARGMNAIALVNIVMAAVLSVLVTLKLIEALIMVAQAILAVLSIFGGATAGIAASLEPIRQEVRSVAETVKPIVENVLVFLHQIGGVIRVIVPIGSNATVLTNIAKRYEHVQLAVAIPPRLTLPVEDDTYAYLCGKAGVMAAQLAMLPLRPILPGFVRRGVSSAAQSLVRSGSGWFCGIPGSETPKVTLDPQVEARPLSPERQACVEYTPTSGGPDNQGQLLCQEAERVDMLAEPNPTTGACRVGERVCMEVRDEDGSVYQPREGSWCANHGDELVREEDCSLDAATPYGRRLLQSRESCRPSDSTRGSSYTQQRVRVTYTWNPTTDVWERGEPEREPLEVIRHDEDSSDAPCGLGRTDPGWNTGDLSVALCTTEGEPPTDPPLFPDQSTTVEREFIEVPQMLGCGQYVPGREIDIGDMDIGEGGGGGGGNPDAGGGFGDVDGGGGSNKNPFKFEEGHLLGTSDMQIRSLVLGHPVNETRPSRDSKTVIEMTKWQSEGDDNSTFLRTSEQWGRLAVAQAEYYFDGRTFSDDGFANPADRRDWLWLMGWTARIRRFRMKWEGQDANGNTVNADGNSQRRDDNADGTLGDYGPGGGGLTAGQANCDGDSQCSGNAGLMERFDSLFLH